MSKHTPEPWHAEFFPNGFGWDVTHGPADDGSERFSLLEDPTEADVRLMAAAPDLLAACKSAMRIAALWQPPDGPVRAEHINEMQALASMKAKFEVAIMKAEQREE